MVQLLQDLARQADRDNRYYGSGQVDRMRAQEKRLPIFLPPLKRLHFDVQLGVYELQLGNEAEAIRRMQSAYRRAKALHEEGQLADDPYYDIVFRAAQAHLRFGETQNCCLKHNADSCLLPIRGGGVHTDQEGSRQAIGYFSEVLRGVEKNSRTYYQAVWLLNIAYMTIGEYPANVPPEFLIPPAAYESQESFPRFANIAATLGLDEFSMSGSVVADDFDRDGWIDLLVGSWDLRGQLRYYRNAAGQRFVERTVEAGLSGLPGGLNMVQADYNNDGFVDVLVLRGAWNYDAGRHPNSLLKNNGDGTFTDATIPAGLAEVHYPTQTASWGDYDLDGDLDLYIGNELMGPAAAPCQLFRNNGDETFTDVAQAAGVTNDRFAKAVVWGDYDRDRYPDIFVSNLNGENRLYRNQRDGTFIDLAPRLGIADFRDSFPAFFWDYNNDGHLDLFVAPFSDALHLVAQSYLGVQVNESLPRLYEGDGKGGFRDVALLRGLREPVFAMGLNFGDLDNDGYLDFYLGTGDPNYRNIVPNKMYRNVAGDMFVDVSASGGFSNLQKGHAVAFLDWDLDGDLDVFEQMGGAFPGDKYADSLYENPGFANHFLALDVVGKESNRSAIGTRIRLRIHENGAVREIYRHVNSGGSFGASPLRQTIGLGRAGRIDELELFWPKTEKTQLFRNVAPNQLIRIVEGEPEFTVLDQSKHRDAAGG
jgi:hypothetical protein